MPGAKGSGPRPKPTAVKKLAGNPGGRELNEREPKPQPGEPPMPPGLSKLAQGLWRKKVPQLRAIGVLTVIDGDILEGYCEVTARLIMARRDIDKNGLFIGEGEHRKKNPAVLIAEKCEVTRRSYMIELGLTPSARARLEVGTASLPAEDQNFFETDDDLDTDQPVQ